MAKETEEKKVTLASAPELIAAGLADAAGKVWEATGIPQAQARNRATPYVGYGVDPARQFARSAIGEVGRGVVDARAYDAQVAASLPTGTGRSPSEPAQEVIAPVPSSGRRVAERPIDVAEAPVQKVVAGGRVVPVQTAPEQLSGPAVSEVKPLHERYASPREAFRADGGMSDSEFKHYVDNHKHIRGLGYVQTEAGLERIIPPAPQKGGIDISKLDPEQLTALSHYMGAQNAGRTAAASEARLGLEGRRADLADRRTDLTEQRYADMTKLDRDKLAFEVDRLDKGSSLKEPMNYVKALESFSPDEVDEFGMKTGKKNYAAGGEALTAMGYPVPKGMKIPTAAAGAPKKGEKKQSPSGKTAVYDGTKWVFEK